MTKPKMPPDVAALVADAWHIASSIPPDVRRILMGLRDVVLDHYQTEPGGDEPEKLKPTDPGYLDQAAKDLFGYKTFADLVTRAKTMVTALSLDQEYGQNRQRKALRRALYEQGCILQPDYGFYSNEPLSRTRTPCNCYHGLPCPKHPDRGTLVG